MMKSLGRRIGKWIATRFPLLWLSLSILFTSYFPAISRYNINTLFNPAKRGYFDFLFIKLQLRSSSQQEGENHPGGGISWWIRGFAVILLVCYLLHVVFKASSVFFEEQTKQNFKKITDERFGAEESTEWTRFFSDKVVSDFVAFFSSFCELFIELWAVISINRTREIDGWFLTYSFLCLVLLLCGVLITKKIARQRGELRKASSFSLIVTKIQQQLIFSELSTMFSALYFLLFAKENEIANAVLLGFNIGSLFSKLRKFTSVVPQTISTYKVWKRKIPHELHILTG